MEALDTERVAIATARGLKVRTVFKHYRLSYHVPTAAMNAGLHEKGIGGRGLTTADSRGITKDAPCGLAVTAALAQMGLDLLSLEDLRRACKGGRLPARVKGGA